MKLPLFALLLLIVGCKQARIPTPTAMCQPLIITSTLVRDLDAVEPKVQLWKLDSRVIQDLEADETFASCREKNWPNTDHCRAMALAYVTVLHKYMTNQLPGLRREVPK